MPSDRQQTDRQMCHKMPSDRQTDRQMTSDIRQTDRQADSQPHREQRVLIISVKYSAFRLKPVLRSSSRLHMSVLEEQDAERSQEPRAQLAACNTPCNTSQIH